MMKSLLGIAIGALFLAQQPVPVITATDLPPAASPAASAAPPEGTADLTPPKRKRSASETSQTPKTDTAEAEKATPPASSPEAGQDDKRVPAPTTPAPPTPSPAGDGKRIPLFWFILPGK